MIIQHPSLKENDFLFKWNFVFSCGQAWIRSYDNCTLTAILCWQYQFLSMRHLMRVMHIRIKWYNVIRFNLEAKDLFDTNGPNDWFSSIKRTLMLRFSRWWPSKWPTKLSWRARLWICHILPRSSLPRIGNNTSRDSLFHTSFKPIWISILSRSLAI